MILRTTVSAMAMGKRRRRAKQTSMWVATEDLPRTAAHPFYTRLNHILDLPAVAWIDAEERSDS